MPTRRSLQVISGQLWSVCHRLCQASSGLRFVTLWRNSDSIWSPSWSSALSGHAEAQAKLLAAGRPVQSLGAASPLQTAFPDCCAGNCETRAVGAIKAIKREADSTSSRKEQYRQEFRSFWRAHQTREFYIVVSCRQNPRLPRMNMEHAMHLSPHPKPRYIYIYIYR